MVLADSVFVKGLLSGSWMVPSYCVLTWWKRQGSSFTGTLIPFMRALLSWPKHLQGPHLLIPSHWALGFQHRNLGRGEIHTFRPQQGGKYGFCFFLSSILCVLKTGTRLRALGKCYINYITKVPCKYPWPPTPCKCISSLTQNEHFVEMLRKKIWIE